MTFLEISLHFTLSITPICHLSELTAVITDWPVVL